MGLIVTLAAVLSSWSRGIASMPGSSQLCPVTNLSDDECAQTNAQTLPASAPGPLSKKRPTAKRMPARARALVHVKRQTQTSTRTLRYKVDGSCGCRCNCFRPFKASTLFDSLVQVHKSLGLMDKLEQDKYVASPVSSYIGTEE